MDGPASPPPSAIVEIGASHPADAAARRALRAAFACGAGDLLAAVGGGGKTSLLFALARDAAGEGIPTVVTTTTRMLRPSPAEADRIELAPERERFLERCATVRPGERLFLARGEEPSGKMAGVDPDWFALLPEPVRRRTLLLAECDGSAGRPLKGHAAHEPALPAAATVVVPVIGLSALGLPLLDIFCHRAARAAELAGAAPGGPITPGLCAALIAHPAGYLRGAPGSARVSALLSGARGREEEARILADKLLAGGRVGRVIIF